MRRSPSLRPDADFDPEELRNELAGAFPLPSASDDEQSAADGNSPSAANDTATSQTRAPSSLPPQSETSEANPAPRNTLRWTNESESGSSNGTDPIERGARRSPKVSEDRSIRDHAAATSADPAASSLNTKITIRAADSNRTATDAFQFSPVQRSVVDNFPGGSPTLTNQPSSIDNFQIDRRNAFRADQQPASSEAVLLVTNQAPVITSDIRGPRQILLGREATFRIRLQNQGAVAAEELVASVRIPSWAEVVDTTATRGIVRHAEGTDATTSLEWQIPRLDAGASQTLHLRLIPRGSRPLEFGVSWVHAPVAVRAVVEVQEPKLQMSVAGPDDVLFGRSYVYRLNLMNPGTGVAKGVRIDLMPPGGGEQSVSTHQLGDLAAGASKYVEVELTAREAGKLRVQAVASAEGGLRAEASQELFCRKPELQVDWRGPQMQYVGTTATYFLRVRNPGTASADDVAVRVALPTGAEFVGASDGHVHDPTADQVVWRVGSLGPGDDCYMELSCRVHKPGENQLRVTAATTAGDLSDSKTAATDVVALADLTLDISDPSGPVLVGEDALYEIRVENRGASAAEDINVVALFSAGLEPEAIEGASYNVADGRVTFRPIGKLPAGQHTILRIRARGRKPGTHVFRAEVLCRDLEIKLAAEETTRFYENGMGSERTSILPTSSGGRYGETIR